MKHNNIESTKINKIEKNTTSKSCDERLIAEYHATQSFALHVDNRILAISSIMLAGVAFLLSSIITGTKIEDNGIARLFVHIFVPIMLTVWILILIRFRLIWYYKLDRIHEIEALLEFKQNKRFLYPSLQTKYYSKQDEKYYNLFKEWKEHYILPTTYFILLVVNTLLAFSKDIETIKLYGLVLNKNWFSWIYFTLLSIQVLFVIYIYLKAHKLAQKNTELF